MAYVALYRSYRPTTFKEVIGQKHVVQTLKNAVMENKTSHAYIFSGLRGIGKTTIARILAKAVNCESPLDGEPCNCCKNCLSIINEETTDIVELDAASNNGVDEMREILEKVNFLPSILNKKVYIIDEAHMLSNAAFNALLKTLEEPPVHVIFILATTEPHKVPATILSRCQRFDFKQFSLDELKEELKYVCEKEEILIHDDALAAIAEAADGGMRDALSILDQASVYANNEITVDDVDSVTGRISNYKLIELLTALKNKDSVKSIDIINSLVDMGKEVSRLISGIIQFCRDLLLYKSAININANKYIYNNIDFKKLAESLTTNELFYYMDVLVDVQNKIRFTNSQKIYLEVGIIKIVNYVDDTTDIMTKLQKLESEISINNGGDISFGDIDAKFNGVDSKIKLILKEIERNNIDEFKEKIEAKIDLLEDVSTKAASLPTDINYRLDGIEDKIRIINNNLTIGLDAKVVDELNQKMVLLEEKLNSKNEISDINVNNLTTDIDKYEEFENKLTNLQTYINTLEEKFKNDENGNNIDTNADIIKEIEELRENYFVIIDTIQSLQLPKQNSIEDLGFDIETNDNYNNNHLEQMVEGLISNINRLADKLSMVEKDVVSINEEMNRMSEEEHQTEELLNNTVIEISTIKEKVNEESITSFSNKINNLEEENKKLKEELEKIKKVVSITKPQVQEQKVTNNVDENKNVYIKPEEKPRVVEINDAQTIQKIHNVYDVRIVERILHESRELECREEKTRLIAAWPKLDDKVGYVLAPISRMLMDGKLAANGKRELLIVLPSATMCNHLMESKNYLDAKQVLRITFGKDYDFLALPENTWQEKRKEYIGQYGVGIKYPKLSPINNPELTVVTVNYEQIKTAPKKPIQQARAFFGTDIVEEEDK